MSLELMCNIIRTVVVDNLLETYTIVWDNDPNQTIRPDEPHLRASIRLSEQRQVSTGGEKRFRQSGTLTFQVYIPLGKGDVSALQAADVILQVFRCRTYSEVTFSTPSSETVGRNDKWWQINVICPFYYDILAS